MGSQDFRLHHAADRGAPLHAHRRGVTLDRVFREASGRSVATLIRMFGDIDIAEDAVQDAYAIALRHWARTCLHRDQPGPYQLQAAINAVHADAATLEETDWPQIVALY